MIITNTHVDLPKVVFILLSMARPYLWDGYVPLDNPGKYLDSQYHVTILRPN